MTRMLFGSPPLESAMTFQSERFGSSMALTSMVRIGPEPGTYWRQELGAYGVGREDDGDVLITREAPR